MKIRLRNGEILRIEVTSFVLEYLEKYSGGIEQLLEDLETKAMHVVNYVLFAIIASNYPKKLSYRQAVGLVQLEDIESILEFVVENIPNTNK